MTPPEMQGQGSDATTPGASPAVSLCIVTLQNRPDFLRAASALRQATGGFLVQARERKDDKALVRVGFTASKKIGNAVARNRAKRRLRALARLSLGEAPAPGWDLVLIARAETGRCAFATLRAEFEQALTKAGVRAP